MPRGKQSAISKRDAVRHAITALGHEAKLAEIRDYARGELGVDISISHISKIKSGPDKMDKARTANGSSVTRAGTSRIALSDIEAAKALTERVGAQNLKALIGMLE